MRTIGFIGIALLIVVNVLGLALAVRDRDWKGIALMLFMGGLLFIFGKTLWRGARLARTSSAERLTPGWAGESLGDFFRNQFRQSLEGRLVLAGSALSWATAVLSWLSPATVGISVNQAGGRSMLFAVWPILAFVLYVKICAPTFRTTWYTVLSVLTVVAAPFLFAYGR